VAQLDLTEELSRLLSREKSRGRKGVSLSPETVAGLFSARIRTSDAASPSGGSQQAPRSAGQPVRPASVPAVAPPRPPVAPRAPAVASFPAAAPAETMEGLDLASLEQRVSGCRKCSLWEKRTQSVFARGTAAAQVVFVGEGPGFEEDQQGLPFVGEAGQLLDRMIAAMDLGSEDVYICNIVKCRPPGNRNPEEAEAAACLPYLERQIELVGPKVIVLLGAVPLRFLLGKSGITRSRGNWLDYKGIPVMPTYHPAYLLRVPQKKRDVWGDLQQVMRLLGKDPAHVVGR
jgi:uracil-DNA glycosylase